MSGVTEVFTIRINIENKEEGSWIWDAIKTGEKVNGVKINAIANGDMFKELDLTQKIAKIYEEECNYIDEDVEEEIEELEKEIEKAQNRTIII